MSRPSPLHSQYAFPEHASEGDTERANLRARLRERERELYAPPPLGPRFQQLPPPTPGRSPLNPRANLTMAAAPREVDMKTLNLTREQAVELHSHDKEIKRIVQSQIDKQLNQKIKDATSKLVQSHKDAISRLAQSHRDAIAATNKEMSELKMEANRLRATITSRNEEFETFRQQRASANLDSAQHLRTNAAPIEPGSLAASGLLFEGSDFSEWKKRMTTILRARHGSVPAELDVKKLHLSEEQVFELWEHDQATKDLLWDYTNEELARREDAAVKLAIESLEKTWQLQMKAKDIAFAKIAAVQKAVQDTPERSVKEVWDVAQKARPTAPSRPASVAHHAAPLTTLAQKVVSPTPAVSQEQRRANGIRVEPTQHEQIADIKALCDYISPSLLVRIPDRVKSNLDLFWAFTSGLAQPLRLLELPVAVRNMIYGLTMNGLGSIPYRQLREPLPPLLAVCKEVRREARPVFFASSMFDYNYTGDLVAMDEAIQADLRQWLNVVVRTETKHLRDVRINLRPSGVGGSKRHIVFSYEPAHGLMAQVLGEGQVLNKPLQELVAYVEDLRKAVGMQGEAIGLVLLSRPEIWRDVVLSFGNLAAGAAADTEEFQDRIMKTEE